MGADGDSHGDAARGDDPDEEYAECAAAHTEAAPTPRDRWHLGRFGLRGLRYRSFWLRSSVPKALCQLTGAEMAMKEL
jgi:hypothetical protein